MKPTLQHIETIQNRRNSLTLTPQESLQFDNIINTLWKKRETRKTRYEKSSTISQQKRRILSRRNAA